MEIIQIPTKDIEREAFCVKCDWSLEYDFAGFGQRVSAHVRETGHPVDVYTERRTRYKIERKAAQQPQN